MAPMKRLLTGLFLVLLFLSASHLAKAAETPPFSVALSKDSGHGGGSFDLTLFYDGARGAVGAFAFRVWFDPEVFTCQPVRLAEGLRDNYTASVMYEDGRAAVVYTQKSGALAYSGVGAAVTYRFQVREGAPEGDYTLGARVEQAVSPQGEPLCADLELELPFRVLGPAGLYSLVPDVGALDQPFSRDQLYYTMSVPYSVKSVTFTAVPTEGATCRVNRKTLGAAGTETVFEITVTADDGKSRQTYQVAVFREEQDPLNSDATLLGLVPGTGELDQEFSPEQLYYTMSVPYDTKEMLFTATPAEGAACRVNRKSLGAEGSETVFEITVTAADGKTRQTYSVTVYREAREPLSGDASLLGLAPDTGELEQEFSPERLHYTMRVPFETTSMTFSATPAEGASFKVNRKNLGAGGSTTSFTITVTAADGKSKQEYHVDVYRQEKESEALSGDASLLALVPDTGSLDQEFSPARTEYTMRVPFSVKSMTFTTEPAPGASCRVNRKNLGAGGSDTEFTFTVTAADGKTQQIYRVTVHREEEPKSSGSTSTSGQTSVKTPAPEKTPAPTKTPKPTAPPTASPTPQGVPVPVEEEGAGGEAAPSALSVEDLPPGMAAQKEESPLPYGVFAAFAGAAALLSGPVTRWLEKRRDGKPAPDRPDHKRK